MLFVESNTGTSRIWLNRNEFPENVTKLTIMFHILDSLSVWGGYDKNEDDYMSWEMPKDVPKNVIERILRKTGCNFHEMTCRNCKHEMKVSTVIVNQRNWGTGKDYIETKQIPCRKCINCGHSTT